MPPSPRRRLRVTYKIALVGEAWGAEEERARAPFVGASGQELTRMLAEAGIHRADCFLTNVFNLRPDEKNDLAAICSKTKVGPLPPIKTGHYLLPKYYPELDRLVYELRGIRPNLVVCLGGTACWAVLGTTGIASIRGTIRKGSGLYSSFKVLPTYHPAAVLRDWSLRPVTVLDLAKARRESEFSEIRLPKRTVFIEPDLADLEWFYETYLKDCQSISFDIETSGNQITCIGFAPGPAFAIVIPFVDARKSGGSYWPDQRTELQAWAFVRRVLTLPQPKIAQNGLYDINFLWTGYGIPVVNAGEDTMLLHHALQPESQKGLGFLGSVYTNESSWKLLGRKGLDTIKRDA